MIADVAEGMEPKRSDFQKGRVGSVSPLSKLSELQQHKQPNNDKLSTQAMIVMTAQRQRRLGTQMNHDTFLGINVFPSLYSVSAAPMLFPLPCLARNRNVSGYFNKSMTGGKEPYPWINSSLPHSSTILAGARASLGLLSLDEPRVRVRQDQDQDPGKARARG